MFEYNEVNVKLSDSQLNNLKLKKYCQRCTNRNNFKNEYQNV